MEDFKVGDMIVAYNQYTGWITHIYYKKEEAYVEFDYGVTDYTAAVIPFNYLKKVEK